MLFRLLITSVIAAIAGGVTAITRLEIAAGDPTAIYHYCEVGMTDARWQDPPLFGRAEIVTDGITVEITGRHLLIVCPVAYGEDDYIPVIAECPKAEHEPCSARRLR